jgi:hypothetical protein
MKVNPTARVILSNTLVAAALAAIWLGYGLLLLIVAIAAHAYLYRMMTPRIPEFTHRGHSLVRHRLQGHLLRNHPDCSQPGLQQLRPSRDGKFRAPQPKRMSAPRI